MGADCHLSSSTKGQPKRRGAGPWQEEINGRFPWVVSVGYAIISMYGNSFDFSGSLTEGNMFITYMEKTSGIVTRANFERHTQIRTMRRYPARKYEIIDADLTPEPVRLVRVQRAAR